MIVSVHQPHFLPWLPYLNKALRSDVFVWLDTVQYRKNYFQNRTRVMDAQGVVRWLTVPVHARHDTTVEHVTLADPRWRQRIPRSIEQDYGRTPFFPECWPALRAAMAESSDNLNDLNWRLFHAVLGLLAVPRPRVVRASELAIEAADPNERLVALCRHLGARRYIAGKGGRGYVEPERFARAGIEVVWQEFDPAAASYRGRRGALVTGLSVIDALFHVGAHDTRKLTCRAWAPER
jgi:hypothetical protein